MAESYDFVKSLHLIFVITWFAGLFYMPRLFIYHIESRDKPQPDAGVLAAQFRIMERRLWKIITWPSAILCTLTAAWMLWWYHLAMHRMYLKFQREDYTYTSHFMRIWNEGATMILFAVVFLAILKTTFDWLYGLVGMIGLAVLIMIGIRAYKRVREREEGRS